MADNREFYSVPEAAALLGVSRIAVFKKVKKGRLPGIRIGRSWCIPATAIAELKTAGKPEKAGGRPSMVPASGPAAVIPPAGAPAKPAPGEHSITESPRQERPDGLDEMGWD